MRTIDQISSLKALGHEFFPRGANPPSSPVLADSKLLFNELVRSSHAFLDRLHSAAFAELVGITRGYSNRFGYGWARTLRVLYLRGEVNGIEGVEEELSTSRRSVEKTHTLQVRTIFVKE